MYDNGASLTKIAAECHRAKWQFDFDNEIKIGMTSDELAILAAADRAKSAWLKLNKERAGITNRAIQRAKYAALSQS